MPQGQSPEQIIYDLATAGDPQVSPDGTQVLFTRSQAIRGKKLGQSQIWACSIDGSGARALVLDGERTSSPRWSPEGAAFSYVSNSEDGSALVYMSIEGGPARELAFHASTISSPAWSPDGEHIAYNAEYDPDNPQAVKMGKEDAPRVRVVRRLDYKQDNRGFLNDVRQHVWLVDIRGNGRRRVTQRAVDYLHPAWSPDGASIAVKVPNRNGMRAQLAIVDAESGDESLIGSADGNVGCWSWSPNGSRIVIAGDDAQSWQLDLFVYEVDRSKLRRLTDDLPCQPDAGMPTVSPPAQPVWINESNAIFHAQRAGASGLYRVNVESGSVELVTEWQGVHSGLSADHSARFFTQSASSMNHTGTILIFGRTSNESSIIVDPNAGLPVAMDFERIDVTRGKYTIEAWLLKPPGFDERRRYPVILDIHEGPNSWYGHAPGPIVRALAGAGFLIVYSNPRGSGSYGREFTQQVIRDWGGEDYLDLMAVVDTVLERPYADSERLGLYGYSYGGFMSTWIIGHTDRFKAAVMGAPIVDLISFFGEADVGHEFSPLQIGSTPWENEKEYRFRSPLSYLDRAETPVLILHGEADDRVPIGQGEQLFVTLASMGKEVEFVRYPGGSHASLTRTGFPAHRVDFLERMVAWFDRWL